MDDYAEGADLFHQLSTQEGTLYHPHPRSKRLGDTAGGLFGCVAPQGFGFPVLHCHLAWPWNGSTFHVVVEVWADALE
jgi:hypothetical protein